MFENEIKPRPKNANLQNYQELCRSFAWDDINSLFSWHTTGRVNIAHEAIDRHADDPERANLRCLIYAHKSRREEITYARMKVLSNKFGNALRSLGVERGDRVFLFMPRVPELFIALAGCAKIGAIMAPLYSDYREGAVKERMLDGQGKILITTTRHRARVPAEELPDLEHIIIVRGEPDTLGEGELSWEALMDSAPDDLAVEWVDRETPLFLIYTSGEDGRPIGLLHTHDAMRGYLMTARWVLDLKQGDVLWTQSRPGWLMNVVYSAFAPWLCGVENFVTGQKFSAEEIYTHIQEYRISVLYTVPTLYRIMIDGGKEAVEKFDLSSLRHLLSVLEPLFPDVIYSIMGLLGLPIYDTWWTAETGMITLANFLCLTLKPGYLGKPCPGIQATVLDADGQEAAPFSMGALAIRMGWPAMARDIWNNSDLFQHYLKQAPWFISNDTAFFDHDNYFFYQGRADDAIIIPAGRVGIGEIEHILMLHPAIAEAGVVRVAGAEGKKIIKAFIALKQNYKPSELIKKKIMTYVQNNLSPETAPSDIEFRDCLPKDKNGKILRMVLKAWELGLPVGNLSDLTGE